MKMVLVAAVVVVLLNMSSNEACRVLNKDVLQKGTVIDPPHFPVVIKQTVQRIRTIVPPLSTGGRGVHYVSDQGFYISSIIRQRLQKAPMPPTGGNPITNP